MSSAICQNFVQNAWKKELCSNCFKSKDEHAAKPKPKPIKLISSGQVEGIIRNPAKVSKPKSVAFSKDIFEVIGFGGEDCYDDEDEDDSPPIDNSSETENSDDLEDDENDLRINEDNEELAKELRRITKENTDFNTDNLGPNFDIEVVKKSTATLTLGKPLVDASGRKKPLLVSITPFGEDANCDNKAKKSSSLVKMGNFQSTEKPEEKNSVILKSYVKSRNEDNKPLDEEKSLLDEISETLENGKNPIQIISRKKIEKEIVLTVPKDTVEPPSKASTTPPILNSDSKPKVNLSRVPPLKRDQEKPIIYQTATAKIDLLNAKNLQQQPAIDNGTLTSSTEEMSSESSLSSDDSDGLVVPDQSRELAGEPDGRADPPIGKNEEPSSLAPPIPPALPLTPPPPLIDSTLVVPIEKPKIPLKPASVAPNCPNKNTTSSNSNTVVIRKTGVYQDARNVPLLTTFGSENNKRLMNERSSIDSSSSDSSFVDNSISNNNNKRRAPRPPPETNADVITHQPVLVRRERASSCSPKIRESQQSQPTLLLKPIELPRLKAVSIDNLNTPIVVEKNINKHTVEKKNNSNQCIESVEKNLKNRGRFSLKKFLRIRKDLQKYSTNQSQANSIDAEVVPISRPRLVIVHPTDLVAASNIDSPPACTNKPPPPPRNINATNRGTAPPVIVPPGRRPATNPVRTQTVSSNNTETIYANIGEVRNSIVPNKPQRTASMREREAAAAAAVDKNRILNSHENMYEYVMNDNTATTNNRRSPQQQCTIINKRSESTVDVSSASVNGDFSKYANIPRSVSLTYCGSETESEIYAPYSVYGSETSGDLDNHQTNNNEWNCNMSLSNKGRTHKLRSKKGRSIVHKNLEDNYGAVITANHEALAQVLENIQQMFYVQPALRGLKNLSNLRWSDFTIMTNAETITVGCKTFHQAMWGTQPITLAVYAGTLPSGSLSLGVFNLTPITEFSDLIPAKYANSTAEDTQVTVEIFPLLQLTTITSYSERFATTNSIQESNQDEDAWKEPTFITLQLINALKALQAQGIEELCLNCFVLATTTTSTPTTTTTTNATTAAIEDNSDETTKETPITHNRRLYYIAPNHNSHQSYAGTTLCECASRAVSLLRPKMAPLLHTLLADERAVTLTQVKSILEFCLWGPGDVVLGSVVCERELALQRWLDLQRATVLHGLVCARVQLNVYEECHLAFLVRSSARMMCDASLLLESSVYSNKRG